MKLYDRIAYSGIWTQPIIMVLIALMLRHFNPRNEMKIEHWVSALLLSIVPSLVINSKNKIAYRNGKRKFGLFDSFGSTTNQDYQPSTKQAAMYPVVDEKLLHKKLTGIVFGKYQGKYVCKDIGVDGHCLIIGGSGSGKSSATVIPTILVNPGTRNFVVDIKGELSFKASKYGDPKVCIFNPADRNQYGYDPLYALNENSSNQEILETMQNIAFSLIQLSADVKDPFWKTSARNLLTGLLIYYFKQGFTGFTDIVDEILCRPVTESIQEVMENATTGTAEYRYIVQFSEMAEETLGGIVSEMNNHLVVFANDDDLRYAFRENPMKVSPYSLEAGYSIYLCIKEEKLTAYYDMMQLILNQTLAELEKRPENAEQVVFILDEMPRILSIGKIDRLLDAARTLRSRRVTLFLVTQSIEALMKAYSESEVTDLISNCLYVVVLSASSSKTQKMVCDWCGKYNEKKLSYSGTGSNRKVTLSFEEKDIVEPADLMVLSGTGEAILISPYGYNRIKKVPYYKDRYLKHIVEDNIRYNTIIQSEEKED